MSQFVRGKSVGNAAAGLGDEIVRPPAPQATELFGSILRSRYLSQHGKGIVPVDKSHLSHIVFVIEACDLTLLPPNPDPRVIAAPNRQVLAI